MGLPSFKKCIIFVIISDYIAYIICQNMLEGDIFVT